MSKTISAPLRVVFPFLLGILISVGITPVFASVTPPKVDWVVGSQTVTMGDNLSKLNLPKDYLFANAEDTYKLMEYMGNPPSKQDIGLVVPNKDRKNWVVIFSYDPIGYVKDDEAKSIDQAAILQSIKEGTEEDNKRRQAQGVSLLHVTGWQEPPHYDPTTHNLVWAIAATEDGKTIVNYNTRKLGRNGVTSINLVTKPENLAKVKPELDKLISNYTYLPGKQYSDFVPGKDKVAEIGLTALIAGGVGAAAVKTGILAKIAIFLGFALKKLWILLVVAAGGIKGLFKGKKTKAATEANPSDNHW